MVDSPDDLYHQYFDKCVIEYLKPYQAVNFVQMAKDFQMNRSQIEMKVISLLQRGHIRGVIDAHNHVYYNSLYFHFSFHSFLSLPLPLTLSL